MKILQKSYFPNDIERLVQDHWDKNQTFAVSEDNSKEKYYCLSMMPYPSGNLHMGHVRNYTIGDVISRYQRMLGKNVLQPIGWDAFGLPAEQAAITNNTSPSEWTYSNIYYMKNQLKSLGFAYDWNRELITCQPQYYKWEQWFFTILYNKGLVYRKTSLVNWCPYHETVLANEQVINNCCWRCHTQIQYKKIPQWFIKITNYADQLLKGLDQLKYWPEKVKIMQRNWIGRSEGMNVNFKVFNKENDTITAYITRLDTFMGITYLVISIDHPIALKISQTNSEIAYFIHKYNKILIKSDKYDLFNIEKEGIFSKIYAIHPITHNKLPIWITNFLTHSEINELKVVAACPAHNPQDLEFAKKYNLPIKPVIKYIQDNKHYAQSINNKTILFNSGKFNGLTSNIASKMIAKVLIDHKLATPKIYYRLKDWGISRQRYWGAPIPMIILKNKIFHPVSEDQLPVILPENIHIGEGINNILKRSSNWIKTTYKNQVAFRDTDTFDTFIESSWYYARYTCPRYDKGMLDSNAANYWLPIDQYIGGIEHAIMHLMYFRFYHRLMRDMGLVSSDEPAKRLLCQGMILADSFYYISDDGQKIWVPPHETTIKRDNKGQIIESFDNKGNNLIYSGMCKMSKSKNNGIDPNIMIQKYGADAVRFFIMFAAPVTSALEWKESGIEGAKRFLNRVWNITYQHIQLGPVKKLRINELNTAQKLVRYNTYQTLMRVTDDIDRRQSFNTALSSIMTLVKNLYHAPKVNIQDRSVLQEALSIVIRLLYPFTPHISFVLWKALDNSKDIDNVKWPTVDTQAIKNNIMLIIIQINGKTKSKIFVPINSDKNIICDIAKKEIFFNKNFKNIQINKIIYIPNKIVNFLTQ